MDNNNLENGGFPPLKEIIKEQTKKKDNNKTIRSFGQDYVDIKSIISSVTDKPMVQLNNNNNINIIDSF